MRAQLKLPVLIGFLFLVFGFAGLASGVFAQTSVASGNPEVENLKKQMTQMEEQLRQLRLQVEKLAGQSEVSQPTGPPAVSTVSLSHPREPAGTAHTCLDTPLPLGRW